MHIGMVLATNRGFPPDIRVEKEAQALSKAGHRVTVLSQRIPIESLEREVLFPGNVYVKRVVIRKKGRLDTFASVVCLIERGWLDHLKTFITDDKVDILHVHDFKMVPTALKLAKPIHVPVVADLHENMPAVFVARRSQFPALRRIKEGILRSYHLWRWYESKLLKECAKVIVVVPEATERLIGYGIKKTNIVIVSNTEDTTTFRFSPESVDSVIVDKYKDDWTVSYIGGIGPHRGVDTLLEATPKALRRIGNLRLVIVGARERDSNFLNREIKRLGISRSVDIIGWQPFEKVYSYMIASKVCVIPYNDFEHTQTTIPHKLFQAMMCSRPVLVSDVKPLKKVVEETRSGRIFRANDSGDLAEKLTDMFTHPEWLAEMGANGKNAALGKYAWRNDAERLIAMYKELNEKYE